ncbi:hypothetical protein MANES_09G042001v8 [Manihot esculenta]|uniref:Uncharacterized protein n=3 Tax=Manihot esculenta TaxID=3983 RepID=A0ACB7H4I8_MANES|nr:hypothetical protein MANES_09G042001v8 [Manihot esculenta]KAG8646919.1 hypothetical protein MANES_09G042001v8 [Manihot esculenta]KAG8646920.1 hypothetical protein MANES_09G042001v8 [Manihot esculenta]
MIDGFTKDTQVIQALDKFTQIPMPCSDPRCLLGSHSIQCDNESCKLLMVFTVLGIAALQGRVQCSCRLFRSSMCSSSSS